jgi:hypothetical protein
MMKRHPVFRLEDSIEITILLRLMNRFNAILVKISAFFFFWQKFTRRS